MITNVRISRKQRLKTFSRKKSRIAIILALVLIILVIGKIYQESLADLLGGSFARGIFRSRYADSPDSLAIRVGQGFLLSNPPETGAVDQDSTGIILKRVRQPWPSGMPLEFYSRSMQDASNEYGMKYSCKMYGAGDSMVCDLRSDNHNKLEITVVPDKKTKLDRRSIGFILKNIYQLDNRDIVKMVDSRVPFGYLATIDVFPAGDIKRKLRSNRVTSIISVVASRGELVKRGVSGRKAESEYRDFASDVLDLHPNLSVIDIERSDDIDRLFVKVLIDEAGKRNINYLYRNPAPDGIDSLAYGAGLTFITFKRITDYTEMDLREIQGLLTSELILSKKAVKIIVSIDISGIKVGDLTDWMKYLQRLGIKVLYINKISDDPEFTITDL